jgi:hypothetical protein
MAFAGITLSPLINKYSVISDFSKANQHSILFSEVIVLSGTNLLAKSNSPDINKLIVLIK